MRKALEPLHDNILLKPAAAERRTRGGLFMPETASIPSLRCEVVAVGRGRLTSAGVFVEPSVRVGDFVHVLMAGPTTVGIRVDVSAEEAEAGDTGERLIAREEVIIAREVAGEHVTA